MEGIALWRYLSTDRRGNLENWPPTDAWLSDGWDLLNPESRSQEFRVFCPYLYLTLNKLLSARRAPWAAFCVAAKGRTFLRQICKQKTDTGLLSIVPWRASWYGLKRKRKPSATSSGKLMQGYVSLGWEEELLTPDHVQLSHPVVWCGWRPRLAKCFVHCEDAPVSPSAQTKLSTSVIAQKRWIWTCWSVKCFHLYSPLGWTEQKPLQCQCSHSQPGLPGDRTADRRAGSHFCSLGMVITFAREEASSQNQKKKYFDIPCVWSFTVLFQPGQIRVSAVSEERFGPGDPLKKPSDISWFFACKT